LLSWRRILVGGGGRPFGILSCRRRAGNRAAQAAAKSAMLHPDVSPGMQPPMNVLVTASASRFAHRLLTELLADSRVELVIGLDQDQADFAHERFVQVLLDPQQPQLARVLQNIQTVIHLAPALADAGRATLLTATQNLCTLAHAAGVRTLVVVSSAFIYDTQIGSGALPEDHARGAPSGCAPAAALQAMEDWLDGFERDHPDLRLVRLRPHWVLGPNSNSLLAWVLRGRRTPRLPPPHPPLQCLHEDDLVAAVLAAVHGSARGAFNLAATEALTLHALHRQARWLRLGTSPETVVRRYGMDRSCALLLRQPLVLDTRRARQELGWQPRHVRLRDILKAGR
jgi:nucleoside-diphosphate-sugar epimerase